MVKKTIAFRCPADLQEEINARASREGRSRSEIVCRLLRDAITDGPPQVSRDQVAGLEDSLGDLLLNQAELAAALVQFTKQVRSGFEATLLNLAPEKAEKEVAKWMKSRFPPIRIEGAE